MLQVNLFIPIGKQIQLFLEYDICTYQRQMNQLLMQQQPNNPVNLNPAELKQMILQHQHQNQKGYYTYEQWGLLHQALLNVAKTSFPVINAWRVLKLINFGDDFVPTGLIFDTLVTLLDPQRKPEETEVFIKSIFFKFIEFNGKFLSQREKQQLAFFKVIRSVVEGYRKLLMGLNASQNQQKDRNHQLYRLHNVFTYRKNLEALRRIEAEFKQCKFQPDLNPKTQMVQSRYLQPRASPFKLEDKYSSNMIIDETEEFPQRGFRAQPVPIYPEVTPTGINEHLARMQKSRQIKRINSLKPYHSGGSQSQVTPFTLNQREQARKQRLPSGYKLLFIIKAEVGKRLYRIKVRQNMSVEQVVKNIELMVGFPDVSLAEIVRGYFANWENRQRQKNISE